MDIETKIENTVKKTIKEYKLLSKKDKLAVAVSGGKDSLTTLFVLNKLGYKLSAVFIDLHIGKYSKENMDNTINFCKELGVKLHIISLRKELGASVCFMRSVLQKKGISLKSCAICGMTKRHLLNKITKKLGFDKVATGHNLDDEAHSFLMNLVKGNFEMSARLGPEAGLRKDVKFIPRIKPLYFCAERDIVLYSKRRNFPVRYEWCPCSSDAFRRKITENLEKNFEDADKIKKNIIRYFIKIMPELKKKFKNKDKLEHCSYCGEPSKANICSMCSLLIALRKENTKEKGEVC